MGRRSGVLGLFADAVSFKDFTNIYGCFLPVECISLWLNRGVLFLVKDDENDSMKRDIDLLKGGGFASS